MKLILRYGKLHFNYTLIKNMRTYTHFLFFVFFFNKLYMYTNQKVKLRLKKLHHLILKHTFLYSVVNTLTGSVTNTIKIE